MPVFLRKALLSLARGLGFALVMYLFQRMAVNSQANCLTVATEFVLNCIMYATIDFLTYWLLCGRKKSRK